MLLSLWVYLLIPVGAWARCLEQIYKAGGQRSNNLRATLIILTVGVLKHTDHADSGFGGMVPGLSQWNSKRQ